MGVLQFGASRLCITHEGHRSPVRVKGEPQTTHPVRDRRLKRERNRLKHPFIGGFDAGLPAHERVAPLGELPLLAEVDAHRPMEANRPIFVFPAMVFDELADLVEPESERQRSVEDSVSLRRFLEPFAEIRGRDPVPRGTIPFP